MDTWYIDTQRKDIRDNDPQHHNAWLNDMQHIDTWDNDTHHNSAQHIDSEYFDTQNNVLLNFAFLSSSFFMPSIKTHLLPELAYKTFKATTKPYSGTLRVGGN